MRWMTADIKTGKKAELGLSHPEHAVGSPRFSPDAG